MGVISASKQPTGRKPINRACKGDGDRQSSEVVTLCKELAAVHCHNADLRSLRRRQLLRMVFTIVLTGALYYLGGSIASRMSTNVAGLLCCILIISWLTILMSVVSWGRKETTCCGAYEVELTAFQQVINNHRQALLGMDVRTIPGDDGRLVVATFLNYALHCIAISRFEQKSGFPLTDRKISRYGHDYLGAFEPDKDILCALGDLLLQGTCITGTIGYAKQIQSMSSDLWILRTKESGLPKQRKTMADDDYVGVQAQFVRYLGCCGDASSLRVLRILARDKRYPALRSVAKQAIEQVKSRIAGENSELLHIPSPAQGSDLLHSVDDHGNST